MLINRHAWCYFLYLHYFFSIGWYRFRMCLNNLLIPNSLRIIAKKCTQHKSLHSATNWIHPMYILVFTQVFQISLIQSSLHFTDIKVHCVSCAVRLFSGANSIRSSIDWYVFSAAWRGQLHTYNVGMNGVCMNESIVMRFFSFLFSSIFSFSCVWQG